jgi:hypothetical protein
MTKLQQAIANLKAKDAELASQLAALEQAQFSPADVSDLESLAAQRQALIDKLKALVATPAVRS